MGARRPSEDRWFPRYYDIVGPCPAQLAKEDGQVFDCRVVDVSRDGLGILASHNLEKDAQLQMEINERKIVLQVVYANEDLIHKGLYRIGLRRILSQENLVSLFAATGCIRL